MFNQVPTHEHPAQRPVRQEQRCAGLGGFMRVTFCVNYGVHEKDGTYEVPDWLGNELILAGKAIKEVRGKDAPALSYAKKIMQPSQVKRKD